MASLVQSEDLHILAIEFMLLWTTLQKEEASLAQKVRHIHLKQQSWLE